MKKVKDLIRHPLQTVDAQESIRNAARRLAEKDIGILPVLSTNRRPVGTLTDRDIVVRGLARGINVNTERVERIMSPAVVACSADDSVEHAATLMRAERVRRLLVTDKDETVQGVVSIGDVARAAEDPRLVTETLQKICA